MNNKNDTNYAEISVNDLPDGELARLLSDILSEAKQTEEASLRNFGKGDLSHSEFHLLQCIADGKDGRRTIGEIASALSVTMPTVTVSVNRMITKGYLVREKNPSDARMSFVSLSDSGKQMNELHAYYHEQLVFNLKCEFNDEELELLYRCLLHLDNYFKNQAE